MNIEKDVVNRHLPYIGGALLGTSWPEGHLVSKADSKQAKLTATETGIVSTKPDQAQISLDVLTTAPHAKEAQQENADLTDKMLGALTKASIAKNKMETKGYSVWPEYSYPKDNKNKPPTISSYRCSNTLIITADNINKTGELIDQAVAAGANQM